MRAPGRPAKHLDLACAGRQRGGQQAGVRLAGPGRTNDGDAFTARNSQVHAAQGVDAVAALQVRAPPAAGSFQQVGGARGFFDALVVFRGGFDEAAGCPQVEDRLVFGNRRIEARKAALIFAVSAGSRVPRTVQL